MVQYVCFNMQVSLICLVCTFLLAGQFPTCLTVMNGELSGYGSKLFIHTHACKGVSLSVLSGKAEQR